MIKEVQAAIPPDSVPLVLARCMEIFGDLASAEKHFLEAQQARPNDPIVLMHVADFHLRQGKETEAIPILRRLL